MRVRLLLLWVRVLVLVMGAGDGARGAPVGPAPHASVLVVAVSVVMVVVIVVEVSSGPWGGPPEGGGGTPATVRPTPSSTAVSTTAIPSCPSYAMSTAVSRGTIHCQSGIYGCVTLTMFGVPIPHSTCRHDN